MAGWQGFPSLGLSVGGSSGDVVRSDGRGRPAGQAHINLQKIFHQKDVYIMNYSDGYRDISHKKKSF